MNAYGQADGRAYDQKLHQRESDERQQKSFLGDPHIPSPMELRIHPACEALKWQPRVR